MENFILCVVQRADHIADKIICSVVIVMSCYWFIEKCCRQEAILFRETAAYIKLIDFDDAIYFLKYTAPSKSVNFKYLFKNEYLN